MKRLYIRADGNKILGLGHIMRCMSIADAIVELGVECEFIVTDKEAESIIEDKGYAVNYLSGSWNDLSREIDNMKDFIKSHDEGLLLVDSYYVDEAYFSELRKLTKIVYLTGNSDKCYDTDALINYVIGSEKLDYNRLYRGTDTKLLLGVRYAPLRKQFDVSARISEKMENILVTTGGTDGGGLAVELFNKVKDTAPELYECTWHIIAGAFYSEKIRKELEACRAENSNVIIYQNVTDMASLMQKCDAAVSAAGSTIYELCACGVPTVAFSFVDNQIRGLQEFTGQGYVLSAGDTRDGMEESVERIIRHLENLKRDAALRHSQAEKMRDFIDGKGAERLAKALISL